MVARMTAAHSPRMFTAEPGTESADKLALLASWSAPGVPQAAEARDR